MTAADIFQTLELSVCMIVDFLQNGDCHSLSQCEKMSPFRGHLRARILFQYYAHVQYLAAVPPTTREGYCSQNNGTRERRQGKKSRHHMEFVNKSSNVFFDRAGMTLKFMVVLHGSWCPHMLGHLKIISFVNPKEKFWWWRGLL